MCFPLGLQFFLCRLGQLIPLTIIVIIIQSLDLMAGFFNKGTETIFLPEIKSYMDRFHVHQIFDLFHALVGNTGSLGDQFFIIFDLCLSAITADQQPVTFSSLIWKLDIKAKFLIDHFLKIDLAYIISSGRNHFALHRLVMFILYPESDLALRGLSQSPSVQCNGIFTDTDHIHFILHLPYRPLHFHLSGQSSAVLLRSQEDASSRAD